MPLDNYFTRPDFSRQIKQYSGTTATLSGQTNILEKFSIKNIEIDTANALDGNALLYDSANKKFVPAVIGAFGSGIVQGLILTYDSGLTYNVSEGSYRINSILYSYVGGNVTISSGQTGGSRFDVVYITSAQTALVKSGQTATNPSVPALSGGELQIGIIFVPVNFTGGTGSTVIQTTADTVFEYYNEGTGIQRSPNTTNAEAPGAFSFALANNSKAYGEHSSALGFHSKASGYSQTVVGPYNSPNTDDYFQVGNGTGDGSRSNAFRVTTGGSAYIQNKLYVTNIELETTGATNGQALVYDYTLNKFRPQTVIVTTSGTSLGNGVRVLFSSDTNNLAFATLSSQTPSTLSIVSSSTGVILFSATTGGISGTYVSGVTNLGGGQEILSAITDSNVLVARTLSGSGIVDVITVDDIVLVKGLKGENFTVLKCNGTPTENGNELIAAYNEAILATPNGNTLSTTNRFTILIPPSIIDTTSPFDMTTPYVDIISLTGEADIIFQQNFQVTGDYVNVTGIDTLTFNYEFFGCNSLPNIVIKKCKAAANSFASTGDASGTFIDCIGGSDSFGGQSGTASGTFTNCIGGIESFGGQGGIASGTFTNCTGGNESFGGKIGTASGTFTNCIGSDYTFGGQGGIASGTFTNCTGGSESFGGGFGGTANGAFTNCTGGDYSFGGKDATASGTFTNCKGGIESFGGGTGGIGTASGTFINCTGGNRSFGSTGTANGAFIDCTGGIESFGGQGVASGTFTNCTGGLGSWGNNTTGGKLYYCRLTSGNFETSGDLTLCIDGNDNIVEKQTPKTLGVSNNIIGLGSDYFYNKIILTSSTSNVTITSITANTTISTYRPSITFFPSTALTITFRNSTNLKTEGGLDAVISGSTYDNITFTYNNNIGRYFQTNINNYI